jgi:exosome complex component RRP46
MTTRPDGRTSGGTLRPLSCELSPLQRADGSALWKAGSTHVLAAVYGPIAPQRPTVEQQDAVVISIIFTGHREYESMLQKVLEGCISNSRMQYSRCVIEIVLQTINDDGSVLSCALHAIVAALMDAGICMNRLPLATTIAVVGSTGALLLDPSLEEEEDDDQTSMTLITSNTEKEKLLGSIVTNGGGTTKKLLSLEQLLACQEASSRASPAVLAFLRLAMEQKVTRQSKTLILASN